MKQTWSFNKFLIVLKEFDGFSSSKEVNMDWCSFWVLVHGLPLGLLNEKINIVLREILGKVLEVETSDDQWMRVRVSINTKYLVKRGKVLTMEEGRKILHYLNTKGCRIFSTFMKN